MNQHENLLKLVEKKINSRPKHHQHQQHQKNVILMSPVIFLARIH